jgi:predicted RNA-binding protein YlqC (UPF0109 family)
LENFSHKLTEAILAPYNSQMENARYVIAGGIQGLVARIAAALVDDEHSVQVTSELIGTQTVLRLQVAPGDVGKLIGKQGRTARSIRTVLEAIGIVQGARYSLDIIQAPRS